MLTEEIVYIMLVGHALIVVSMMRLKRHSEFSGDVFENLSQLEPVVRKSFLIYSATQATGDFSNRPHPRDPAHKLETAFSDFAKYKLSSREQTVSLLLRGHLTLSVAHNLGIAEGTAKIHRKNIYEKLHISSQTQLFMLVIANINATDSACSATPWQLSAGACV